MAYISESRIVQVAGIVSRSIGAALLIESIVNLYVVQDNTVKIVLIGVYAALFATSISLLTNAKQAELFASTAAYAAVLVVFVSENLSCQNNG